MKIVSAAIEMAASHAYSRSLVREERLLVRAPAGEIPARQRPPARHDRGIADRLSLSAGARQRPSPPPELPAADGADDGLSIELSPEDRRKIKILEYLWRQLTGKEVHLRIAGLRLDKTAADDRLPPAGGGIGMEYHEHQEYREEEKTAFSSSGVVRTADGREMAFRLDLQLEREFVRQTDFSLQIGDPELTDPLVINYAGPAADLAADSFAFDLNLDGRPEQLPALRPGSGFLALDRNGDGLINDGSELFGPGSGDGFAELRRYDLDGNHWLDENDPVFARLQIWLGGDKGQGELFSLREKGIGAICLETAATPFTLTDSRNQALGQVRASGLFLREDGTAGSLQQVDLAT